MLCRLQPSDDFWIYIGKQRSTPIRQNPIIGNVRGASSLIPNRKSSLKHKLVSSFFITKLAWREFHNDSAMTYWKSKTIVYFPNVVPFLNANEPFSTIVIKYSKQKHTRLSFEVINNGVYYCHCLSNIFVHHTEPINLLHSREKYLGKKGRSQ